MKRLIIIALIMTVTAAFAASQKLYDLPTATKLNDDDRMYLYQNASGSKNLTGAGLKSVAYQEAWNPDYVKTFQTNSSATTSPNEGYKITNLTRNRRGVITGISWENGGSLNGIPVFNHLYVYPFNGMTNVSRSTPLVVGGIWRSRGVVGTNISIPGVSGVSIKGLFYGGKNGSGLPQFGYVNETAATQDAVDAFFWGTASVGTLAANTTYTIRSSIYESWGRGSTGYLSQRAPGDNAPWGTNPCTYSFTNNSSAHVMENYSTNLCRSTFRTGAI
jgi:hypothetical protein